MACAVDMKTAARIFPSKMQTAVHFYPIGPHWRPFSAGHRAILMSWPALEAQKRWPPRESPAKFGNLLHGEAGGYCFKAVTCSKDRFMLLAIIDASTPC